MSSSARGCALELWELSRPLLAVADRLSLADRVRLQRLAATCLNNLGDYPAAQDLLDKCRADLGDLRGTADECLVLREVCSVLRKRQLFEPAAKAGLEALDLARKLNRPEEQASAIIELAALERNRGRPGDSVRLATTALELADQTDNLKLQAVARSTLARNYTGGASLKRADQLYREALALCRQSGDVATQAQTLQSLADIARKQTRNADALQMVNEAIAIFQRIGDRTGEGIARHCLGLTLLQMGKGRAQEGLQELRRSVQLAFELNHPREVASALSSLALPFEKKETLPVAAACYQTVFDLHVRMGRDGKKGQRALDKLRPQAEAAGATWADIEREAQAQRWALLEKATTIAAASWQQFLAEQPETAAEPAAG